MEGNSRKDKDFPQLLDLIPKDKSKSVERGEEEEEEEEAAEEKRLELKLGPPDKSHVYKSPWKEKSEPFVIHELSESCGSRGMVGLPSAEKKALFPVHANTAQKRVASPVVGWPPIRSFRKNLASCSSCKLDLDNGSQNLAPTDDQSLNENQPKSSFFFKINMEGVPIGRKVNLKAHDSYEKLSSAVDHLFSSLLAAQCAGDGMKRMEEITGLLDGSGEYTLVYEDNEGNRTLVRDDVPWNVFESKVKRLRVLKTSKLPTLSGGSNVGKLSTEAQLN